ncbi:MAG: ABC transporter substrate-binding protein [Bacillota bacterium]|nr:ABC transporter substrate-binding protein [Bacillota bacterium]
MKRFAFLTAALLLLFALSGAAPAKNVVTMSLNQEIGTIDPAKVTDWTEAMVMVNLYDSLVTPDAKGEIQGLIAKSWTVSPDGKVYTFHLNKGVKFHDGREVTAEDVVFSMERVLALKSGYSWLWADLVAETKAVDKYTVTFRLNKPFAPFLSTLPWLAVVNKAAILEHKKPGNFGQYGDYGQDWLLKADAGSGAYTFKSWTRGNEIVFAKFDGYFKGWRKGAIDEVRAKEVYNDATIIAEMKTGALTIADHYRALETYSALAKMKGVAIKKALSGEAFYLKINTRKAPTDNVHVRRAINYAFDYDAFLQQIDPGAEQARGPIPATIPGFDPTTPQFKRDVKKAREELAKSGLKPDDLTINFCYVQGFALEEKLALLFQANLAEVGLKVVLQPETWGRITDIAAKVETTPHVTAVFSAANYPDADNYLYTAYHSDAVGTWMSMEWLKNPEIDKLIETGRVTVDPKARQKIYSELQHKIVELAPDVFIYSLPKRYAMQTWLKGFEFVPVMSFEYDFHKMWVEK